MPLFMPKSVLGPPAAPCIFVCTVLPTSVAMVALLQSLPL
jgi:hypothetical protein